MTRAQTLFVLAVTVAACGPPVPIAGDGCDDGDRRCVDDVHQICEEGRFVDVDLCETPTAACVAEVGCVACDPARITTCVGDDTYACDADGTIGEFAGACLDSCVEGRCSECDAASRNIYLLSSAGALLSFDPAAASPSLTEIGVPDCTPGPNIPELPFGGPAAPNSMAVDRRGRAWILYTSGEVFQVDLRDADCAPAPIARQIGAGGFSIFGMGFAASAPGSSADTLFIAGGSPLDPTSLGTIDPSSLQTVRIDWLRTNGINPELTGDSLGRLHAFLPGTENPSIESLDPLTAEVRKRWNLPAFSRPPNGYAFAHWGGSFYIFINLGFTTELDSRILRFDPRTGVQTTLADGLSDVIVGAGVSTCAPVVVD